MELWGIYVGERLGLYRALAEDGAATAPELAAATATNERYAREWLEQQAVAGILEVEDERAEPEARRFRLPEGHDEVLLERDSLYYVAPFAQQMVGLTRPLPAVLEAYRTGGGVPYREYGEDIREGIAYGNRPMFVNLMGTEWLPAVPDVHERLQADPPARVADVGCGSGWSSISIARAYPKARIDGFDLDRESIDIAEQNLRGSGVEAQVRFLCENGAAAHAREGYDLVTIFEALHDMANPVEVLTNARGMLAENGVVLVMDEKAAHEFHAPADQLEQLYYGFSVLFCLPVSRSEDPSAATGTAMRPHTMEGYAAAAGYASCETLPIENDLFRFYLLRV